MNAPTQRVSTEGSAGLQGFSPEQLYFLGTQLDEASREYIQLYYERFRKNNKLATEASNKWQERSDFLNGYCEANKYSEFQKREKKRTDWKLNDAMDAWGWHAREAARCEAVISMELNMRILMGGCRAK